MAARKAQTVIGKTRFGQRKTGRRAFLAVVAIGGHASQDYGYARTAEKRIKNIARDLGGWRQAVCVAERSVAVLRTHRRETDRITRITGLP